MKRKLIDIKDSTFKALSEDAAEEGTNLKNYIENILDQKARHLEDSAVCNYRLTSSDEPSDKALTVIMTEAARNAASRKSSTLSAFFEGLEQSAKHTD